MELNRETAFGGASSRKSFREGFSNQNVAKLSLPKGVKKMPLTSGSQCRYTNTFVWNVSEKILEARFL